MKQQVKIYGLTPGEMRELVRKYRMLGLAEKIYEYNTHITVVFPDEKNTDKGYEVLRHIVFRKYYKKHRHISEKS